MGSIVWCSCGVGTVDWCWVVEVFSVVVLWFWVFFSAMKIFERKHDFDILCFAYKKNVKLWGVTHDGTHDTSQKKCT